MLTAETLLAGPRGRRLCGELRALGAADTDPDTLLRALGRAVGHARYWQEPDEVDRALALEAARAELRPAATAIAAAPGAAWWATAADRERQRYVQFLGGHPKDEPRLSGAAERTAAWRSGAREREEAARELPAEPLGAWSGRWWSTPALSGFTATSRALPGLGAAGLALVEDSLGWESARCWPLRPGAGARIYEVDGPAAWGALVTRYPLDVTASRRHDWWQATGWAGPWLMPDYQAVARDYDAVHVSVLGYLATAGTAVPAGPGDQARALLAGWDPDATWWLTDALAPAGPPEEWVTEDGYGAVRWHPRPPATG